MCYTRDGALPIPLGPTMNAVEPDRITRKEYPTFGECIYCGARAGDAELTDEHIVPYSLGGNAFIRDGSCKACAAETTKCERELAKVVLGDFRNSIGEQTRRPKKRAKVGSFVASINYGPRQTFTVPIADLPFFTPMPVWGLPGMMRAELPAKEFKETKAHVYHWVPPNIRETLKLGPFDVAELPFPEFKFDHHKVARAFAKIGYCQAILYWGLRGFDRLDLPELVLGRYPMVPFYVGCPLIEPDSPQEREVKHAVWLSEVDQAGKKFYLAELRLFGNSGTAEHGMPVYYVVVGAPLLR